MYSEMMTLQEVCEYFRVEKRVLQRYGLERLGGVRWGHVHGDFHVTR